MTLAEFLLARSAEDEAVAKKAAEAKRAEYSHGEAGVSWIARDGMVYRADLDELEDDPALWDNEGMDWRLVPEYPIAEQFARWDPARVRAECDAKRRIVERWQLGEGDPEDHHPVPDEVLRLLALPYADHPDYQPSWRP
jgi:hypothetical protein